MSVKQIVGWQTSVGKCYGSKEEAYHEEMVWLMRTQAEANRRGFDPDVFVEVVGTQRGLVKAVVELKETLSGNGDVKIVEEVDLLLQYAEEWLEQAVKLQAQMEGREVEEAVVEKVAKVRKVSAATVAKR